jgi:Family of unknown function (DUF6491)
MLQPVKILPFLSFAALAACAVQPYGTSEAIGQSSARQCFLANEVNSYTPGPDGFVNVRVCADRWFGMRLNNSCPHMDWLMQIAIRPRDSNWLCQGQNSFLIAPDPAGLNRSCFVSEIRLLSPGEVASIRQTETRIVKRA